MNRPPLNSSVSKSTIALLFYFLSLPVVLLAITILIANEPQQMLAAFRTYSVALMSMFCGVTLGSALWLNTESSSVEFKAQGAIWGAGLLIMCAWSCTLLETKVGVFISALLFLVLWQVELKTNLTKIAPLWFGELKTKVTMLAVVCHMTVWMLLS